MTTRKTSLTMENLLRRVVVALAVFSLLYSAYTLFIHGIDSSTCTIDESCKPTSAQYTINGHKLPVVQDSRTERPALFLASWMLLGLSTLVIAHYLTGRKTTLKR